MFYPKIKKVGLCSILLSLFWFASPVYADSEKRREIALDIHEKGILGKRNYNFYDIHKGSGLIHVGVYRKKIIFENREYELLYSKFFTSSLKRLETLEIITPDNKRLVGFVENGSEIYSFDAGEEVDDVILGLRKKECNQKDSKLYEDILGEYFNLTPK